MGKKKEKPVVKSVQDYIDAGELNVNDLLRFIAEEEVRRGNGVATKCMAAGSIITPGIGQGALYTHYVRLAQVYLRARHIKVKTREVYEMLYLGCATQIRFITMSPKKYLEAMSELHENEEKEEEA